MYLHSQKPGLKLVDAEGHRGLARHIVVVQSQHRYPELTAQTYN
jgi:hypothetical protein